MSVSKIDKFGNRLWTEDIPNTSDVIPADLCISDDVIYYGGHTGRNGAGDPFDYSCISIDTNINVNWIKHYANPRGYSLSHEMNYTELRQEQMVYICLEELVMKEL